MKSKHSCNGCRIERYQTVIETEFSVHLGTVRPKELHIGEWLDVIIRRVSEDWHRSVRKKKGRAPNSLEQIFMKTQVVLTRVLMWLPAYIRYWYPDFIMQWDDRSSSIYVPFYGWDSSYFEANYPKIDQWIVHEMAHGVWNQLAPTDSHRDRRHWRLWNEGFAHFIADVHLRPHYPPNATIFEDWTTFRRNAKRLVSNLVDERGSSVLNEIPVKWHEFSSEPDRRKTSATTRQGGSTTVSPILVALCLTAQSGAAEEKRIYFPRK